MYIYADFMFMKELLSDAIWMILSRYSTPISLLKLWKDTYIKKFLSIFQNSYHSCKNCDAPRKVNLFAEFFSLLDMKGKNP